MNLEFNKVKLNCFYQPLKIFKRYLSDVTKIKRSLFTCAPLFKFASFPYGVRVGVTT